MQTDEQVIEAMARELMRCFNSDGQDVGFVLFVPTARRAFAFAEKAIRERCAEEVMLVRKSRGLGASAWDCGVQDACVMCCDALRKGPPQ